MNLKNFAPVLLSIIIGYLIGYFIFTGYQKEVEAYNLNTKYIYAIQIGVYNNISDMENATKSLSNYLYIHEDDYYKVYGCMTNNKEISLKLKDIFSTSDNNIYIREMPIYDINFVNSLNKHDIVMMKETNSSVLYKECSKILTEYKEVLENN